MSTATRSMPPMPKAMKDLPVDPKRGFVVPWFVQWIGGQPDFRIMDARKLARAVRDQLCWVCGKPLRGRGCFLIGPMCAVNRNTAEPPGHPECARFSAMACPFLTMPKMRRREDELSAQSIVAGHAIKRNPGVALLWFAKSFEILRESNGLLFRLGDPLAVEWYAEGREATREEVMHSIETGLPILREMAEKDGPEALAYLERETKKALRLVPAI
jgi:hypothetical protein